MRLTLWEPAGPLDSDAVGDALSLVVHDRSLPAASDIAKWTVNELRLAYDWAMREHFSASDNPVRRRPRPHFTIAK